MGDASNAATFVQPVDEKSLVGRRVGWTGAPVLRDNPRFWRFDRLERGPYRWKVAVARRAGDSRSCSERGSAPLA